MSIGSSTQAVHGGDHSRKPYGAITTPVVQSSTFTFEDSAEIHAFMQAKQAGNPTGRHEYGRYSNPTTLTAEFKCAELEGADKALLFSSGMAAITTPILTYLSQGDHLILVRDCYHRTREFALAVLFRYGIDVDVVPLGDYDALQTAIRPATRMIFAETPTNPYLRIVDIERLAEIARPHHILTFVDSTFATPLNLRPLDFGIDLVIHSASKYLGGHNDLLAGVLLGSAQLLEPVEHMRGILGNISNPNDAYLLLRGLKTLALRVACQNRNGQAIAEYLNHHPAVQHVHYPGLTNHPEHTLAANQMSGYGGVVSFEIAGDFQSTAGFIDRLRIPYIGPTLGGVESIVQQPAALFSLNPAERAAAGFKDNLVRYAAGIEDAQDLIADLEQALAPLLHASPAYLKQVTSL